MAQPTQTHGLHNLSTVLKRLEAVTSRLEDIAHSQSSVAPTASLRSATSAAHDGVAGHVGGGVPSSSSAPPPPPPPPPPAPSDSDTSLAPAAQAYRNEIMNGPLDEFLSAAKAIGGVVEQHSQLIQPLVAAQLAFIQVAVTHAQPSQDKFQTLLKPQADAIGAVIEGKDKLGRSKEGREYGVCLSVVGEGVAAWGWVQDSLPTPYVNEMKNASQFWVDRVIKQFKETKPEVVTWAKSFIAILEALAKYVKQWHTTGVAWNKSGPEAPPTIPTAGSADSASQAPPPPVPSTSTATSGGGGGVNALLADLNKGGAITSGLRKVDPSQQTHKNPQLRASSVVPDESEKKSSGPPPIKAKPGSLSTKKPAKLELEDGKQWLVEYQEDNRNIVIDKTELHQTIHIFGCKNSVIRITGKINAVTMVSCKKTSIVLESVVSSLSITSSPSFEVQITGTIPTIQIDTTDSGQVYLSKDCMDSVEIITSKTSAINVSLPTGEDGDFEEKPVPEQLKSRVINGKLVTEIVEHAG